MNKSYTQYKESMLGKRVDADNAFGYQCVDLFKNYCKEVLGIAFGRTGNAKEIRSDKYNIFWDKRTKIVGSKNLQEGDIAISTKGGFGHIAICDHTTEATIAVLEQNGAGEHHWNGLWANAIRVHDYDHLFFQWGRRYTP